MEDLRKNLLERRYKEAVDVASETGVPTAIILIEHPTQYGESDLWIDSFSLAEWADEGVEGMGVRAQEEARMLGRHVWVIGIVGTEFMLEPDAFETAWQQRQYFHDERELANV